MDFSGTLSLFAATPPGLEDVTAFELRSLGIAGTKSVAGGVVFEGDISTVYRVNLWSRTAQRVLIRLDGFFAVHLAQLHRKLRRVPWETFLDPTGPITVKATCRKSRIYHSAAAAERCAWALQERLELDVPPDFGEGAPQECSNATTVVLRLEKDHCTVSLDSSGEHLHRRGYRTLGYEAPIRENLAAALLLRLDFDGRGGFWDPMCGSGTVPIEAAMIAANIAPGLNRSFAFMRWPGFNTSLWATLVQTARSAVREPDVVIGGSDINLSAISISKRHAEMAGVDKYIRFEVTAIDALRIPADEGLMLSNPPYGKRIGERRSLKDVYHRFGAMVVRHGDGWKAGFVASDADLAAATGIDMRPVGPPFPNGGIRIRLYSTVS
jgi:putative N6-adenine-specific DNA methylase